MFFRKITIGIFVLTLLLIHISVEAMSPARAGNLISLQSILQEPDFKAKYEELPPEYRERARKLGYKEGDIVSCRRDANGNLVVLPPIEGNKTVEQMKAKLLLVLAERVCKTIEDPVDVTATLNPDDWSGYFTVRVKGENLKEEFEKQAGQQGFKKDDTVAVRIDAVTWEPKVAPKAISFSARLIKVIPPVESGGRPTIVMAARFGDLPSGYQKLAIERGYRKSDEVFMESRDTAGDLKIIPRSAASALIKAAAKPFLIGIRSRFEKLDKKQQKMARAMGYKEGDVIWRQMDSGEIKLQPAADVGDGPNIEIVGGELKPDSFNPSEMKMVMYGLTTFEKLKLDQADIATEQGFKPGDRVGVLIGGGKFAILSPKETQEVIARFEKIDKEQKT